jgi:hypothetical protein
VTIQDSPRPSGGDISFPVEGATAWPFVIRLIAFASVFIVAVLTSIFTLLIPPEDLGVQPEKLLAVLGAVLVFEVVLVRRLIVPLNGDYGRYTITRDKVDYYPLSTLGMRVLPEPETIPLAHFKGVSVQTIEAKDSVTRYSASLVHPKRSRTIRVRMFLAKPEAEEYARRLADALSLKMI